MLRQYVFWKMAPGLFEKCQRARRGIGFSASEMFLPSAPSCGKRRGGVAAAIAAVGAALSAGTAALFPRLFRAGLFSVSSSLRGPDPFLYRPVLL